MLNIVKIYFFLIKKMTKVISLILNNNLTKSILFSCFFIIALTKINAQEILFPLEQDSIVRKLIDEKKEIDSEEYQLNYYTIQLYYGNYLKAKNILDEFKRKYPEWEANLSFETPNYKVQVGNFKNYYNSIRKLNEIKKIYPSAFLLKLKL